MTRRPQAQKQPRVAGSSRPVGLGFIGVGTVGTGTIEVRQGQRPASERRLGGRLQLNMICPRSIHKKDLPWDANKPILTPARNDVVHNPAVNTLVELVGKLP